jgi:Glycosyl hydrolase family 76
MRWRAVVAVAAAAIVMAGVSASAGAAPRGAHGTRTAAFYLGIAQQGLSDVQNHWYDAEDGWYYDTYNRQPPSMPLARLWSAFPLFETLDGIALAQPTPANKAALQRFADAAARLYWNPYTKPFGGYDWYPNYATSTGVLYYDDSGWWGLAFIDAYKATHKAVYLDDARLALQFIVGSGWDTKGGGGTWWDTRHSHKTIEPLAAAVLIATRLYEAQHHPADLATALKLLNWANTKSFNTKRGLYQRSDTDDTVMDYVQGLMTTANWELCQTLKKTAYCQKAKQLANAAVAAFPHDLNWSPQFDVVYLRWMLEYGKESGDGRWYQLAADNAERALANARNGDGYFENEWNGSPLGDGLAHEAANLELFAWLAATAPSSS